MEGADGKERVPSVTVRGPIRFKGRSHMTVLQHVAGSLVDEPRTERVEILRITNPTDASWVASLVSAACMLSTTSDF